MINDQLTHLYEKQTVTFMIYEKKPIQYTNVNHKFQMFYKEHKSNDIIWNYHFPHLSRDDGDRLSTENGLTTGTLSMSSRITESRSSQFNLHYYRIRSVLTTLLTSEIMYTP